MDELKATTQVHENLIENRNRPSSGSSAESHPLIDRETGVFDFCKKNNYPVYN